MTKWATRPGEAPTSGLDGFVEEGFGGVADVLRRDMVDDHRHGGACCIHVGGRLVVDVWGGTADPTTATAFDGDTLEVLHNAATGPISLTVALLIARGVLRLDEPIATWWPEFASNGKEGLTLRCLLQHASGLLGDADSPTRADTLAAQAPAWLPGTAHGYDGTTIGCVLDEVVRRQAGRPLGAVFTAEIASVLGLDCWMGLPGKEEWRVAPLRWEAGPDDDVDAACDASRSVLGDPAELNRRTSHVSGLGAISTARALSSLYARAGADEDARLGLQPVIRSAMDDAVDGLDRVLGIRTRFALGFSLATPAAPMLGRGSFGCIGIGNAMGFGDLDSGVGFAYVSNRFPRVPRRRASMLAAVRALRRCLG